MRARGGGTQRLGCETTGECTSWQSMAWRGSRLEEVTCGSFYTSACWPALVMMRIEPAPGPQSLCLPAGLGNHHSYIPVFPSVTEGVSLSVSLHAEFDTGLCLWSLSLLAQLDEHLLLGSEEAPPLSLPSPSSPPPCSPHPDQSTTICEEPGPCSPRADRLGGVLESHLVTTAMSWDANLTFGSKAMVLESDV